MEFLEKKISGTSRGATPMRLADVLKGGQVGHPGLAPDVKTFSHESGGFIAQKPTRIRP